MNPQQALEGLVVVEFAAFAAGPCVGKYLANHGAFVAKVESKSRLDGFRMHYPPYKDNKKGVNRSGVFAMNNDSVYSIGINLKVPAGLEVARKLVSKSDVIIENFIPGTMERLGLGYEELRKLNPRLVMLSTCNQGQTGPRAQHPGFGSQLTSLSGFTHLTGEPDKNPVIVYGPYIDYIAVGYGYISILAAIEHRRHTGRGQYIDLSQYETGVQFVTPALLQYQILGTAPGREGNRHPDAAPHCVYPCAGEDNWCSISVFNDFEWVCLVNAMERPQWARSPRFATQLSRKENEPELDRLLSDWTHKHHAEEIMQTLQKAGVHAAKVNRIADLFDDPQLARRRYWRPVLHKEVGVHHAEMPAFELSLTPCVDPTPEPCLSEHTFFILERLLGLDQDAVLFLSTQGAIELSEGEISRVCSA